MCLSATVVVFLVFTNSEAVKAEDQANHFHNSFAPSTVNFNEIFTNSLSLLEEPTVTGTKDEDFHLNLPSQFVEFRPHKQETTTTPTPPPPMFILNSSYLKKEKETEDELAHNNTSTTTTTLPVSQKPTNKSMNVLPIQKKKRQRGVLDLLFPASRVRTFKGVFDTFRRILSHTFRRR